MPRIHRRWRGHIIITPSARSALAEGAPVAYYADAHGRIRLKRRHGRVSQRGLVGELNRYLAAGGRPDIDYVYAPPRKKSASPERVVRIRGTRTRMPLSRGLPPAVDPEAAEAFRRGLRTLATEVFASPETMRLIDTASPREIAEAWDAIDPDEFFDYSTLGVGSPTPLEHTARELLEPLIQALLGGGGGAAARR